MNVRYGSSAAGLQAPVPGRRYSSPDRPFKEVRSSKGNKPTTGRDTRPTARGPHADVLSHLGHQGQPVQCRLINAAHLVEHKQAGEQHRQAEDLSGVLPRLQAGGRAGGGSG